jgi:catechol 2,3-dioxygenase-like lactoylglutathione lyase family enzyme
MVRALGINHVALEVGSIDEALTWYGRFFEFELRGRSARMAWIDLGDQFIALAEPRTQSPDEERHLGLVVDDKEECRRLLQAAGVQVGPSGGLQFLDPWGNYIQVVDYREVQFTKTPQVLEAMVPGGLEKTDKAKDELRKKGLLRD